MHDASRWWLSSALFGGNVFATDVATPAATDADADDVPGPELLFGRGAKLGLGDPNLPVG